MRLPFARRPLPPAPPEGAPVQVTDVAEAEVAVGALAGVAPSRVVRHVVIVLDDGDQVRMTTSCCKHELAGLVARAGVMALRTAMEPGPCHHQLDGAS
jgi:hypothetical protein